MTRWQIIRVLLIAAYRVLVKRDYLGLLRDLLPKEAQTAQPVKAHPSAMGFSPELRKMVRGGGVHLLALVLFAGVAMAAGQITVSGFPPTPLTIKGGTGINIAPNGIITATGEAVISGNIPFDNISTGLQGKYLPLTGTATSANAYKGNSAPSATEFSYLDGVSAPIQGQISSVRVTTEAKPDASNVTPVMNGIAAAGTAPTVSRADHIHASDTSREPANANIQSHIGSSSNPHSVTKAQVGLGNADNTSDLNKPISTATQTALNLKANTSSLATVATTGSYTDLANKPAVYTLPTASTTVKGGVKIDGTSIIVDGNGVISSTVSAGVSTVNGGTGDVTVTPENIGAATLAAFSNYTGIDRVTVTAQAITDAAQDSATAAAAAVAGSALQPTGVTSGTITDTDTVAFARSGGFLSSAWSGIKAALKTYFDSVYSAVTHTHASTIYLTYPTGITAINNAIVAAPNQSKIVLPSGTIDIGSGTILIPLGKHYITLEGAGGGAQTIIQSTGNGTALKVGEYTYSGANDWNYGTHAVYGTNIRHIQFKNTSATKTSTVAVDLRGSNNGNFDDLTFSGFLDGMIVNPKSNWNQITNIRSVGTDTANTVKVNGVGYDNDYNSTGNTYANIQGQSVKTSIIQMTGCTFGDAVISNVIGTGAATGGTGVGGGAIAGVYFNSPGTTCTDGATRYASNMAISNVDMDGTADAVIKEVNGVEGVVVSGLVKGGAVTAKTDVTAATLVLDDPQGVSDTAYDATAWNGDTTHSPSKNAVRDKIESILASAGTGNVTGPLSSTNNALAQFSGTTGQALKDGPTLTTSIGTPGVDTKVPTEKAVRDAIAAGVGTIGGGTGATDNAILRADGTGGSTVQGSAATIDDNGSASVGALVSEDPAVVTGLTATPASGGSLAQNTTYYFKVVPRFAAGKWGRTGTEVSASTTTTDLTINLEWAAVSGATTYDVYIATTSGVYGANSYKAAVTAPTVTYSVASATASAGYPLSSSYFTVSRSGVGLGTTTPVTFLDVFTQATGATMSLRNEAASASAGSGQLLYFNRPGNALPQSGDRLGYFLFGGYDGSTARNSALIGGWASEAWEAGAKTGAYLRLETVAAGGTTRAVKVLIGNGLVVKSGAVLADDPGAGNLSASNYILAGYEEKTASYTVSKDASKITLASGTATVTLTKTLPANSEANAGITVAGAAASGVSFAVESGGSISWGDAGVPTFTNNKTADVVCKSQNVAATTTAAWRCTKGGNF